GYTSAGKTGTAQKVVDGHYSKTKFWGSFAGFAPANNPTIAMIVVVDEAVGLHQGGQVAAPVFKRIAEQALHYMSVPSDIPSYLPQYKVQETAPKVAAVAPSATPADPKAGDSSLFKAVSAASYEEGDITIPDFYGKS